MERKENKSGSTDTIGDGVSRTNQRGTWSRLKSNPLAVTGFLFISLAFIIALLGYLISPDKTPHCNQQFIELSAKKPGFKVEMLKVRKNEPEGKDNFLNSMIMGKKSNYDLIPFDNIRFEDDYLWVTAYRDVGETEILEKKIHIANIVYPVSLDSLKIKRTGDEVVYYDLSGNKKTVYIEMLKNEILLSHIIHKKFLLGTDRFGRDMLSRLMLGTRVSISVGFISVAISLLIGITLGALAGYFRGRTDDIIMWLINVVWSIPTLLMVISLTLVLGKGFWQVFVAVGLTMWVEVARVVRGQVLSIREKEYIEAARTLGYNTLRILSRHVIPNVLNPVIIISAANFASAILIEAGLSFLGIGVQPPVPSWGTMIRDHYGFIIVDKAYLAFLPGLAIMIMVLSFTLVGNGLRDALDVRTR